MSNFFLKQAKSFSTVYKNMSVWGLVLFFVLIMTIVIYMFKDWNDKSGKETFIQNNSFVFKSKNNDIYDDFYANVYDHLVFNGVKNDYEVGEIINNSAPGEVTKVLDIGCGTGHHVNLLSKEGLDVIGIDKSPAMISKAEENYPNLTFKVADGLNDAVFADNMFTHIVCLYFTFYYFKDKEQFFDNCMKWLMPGGTLVLHLVNKDKFDPILPPGNPLMMVSPQKYAKKRITSTKVKFNDFSYSADFEPPSTGTTVAKFNEKFKSDKTGKVRKNEHIMYMDDINDITAMAQRAGFILQGIADLVKCQYEYQYLYIFVKPN
jgi:SAM-dependent methyltransferase